MPAGSKPGERRGNAKGGGKLNKTLEAEQLARYIVEKTDAEQAAKRAAAGHKLSEDVLREFMMLFAGMAAVHQPLPPGMAVPVGREPNEAKFEKWARLTCKVAADLIPYERPAFRAINVPAAAPTGASGPKKKRFTLDVFEGSRHAGRVIDGQVIPMPQPKKAAPANKKASAK